jgi:anti-sigma-K factor RskA
MTGQEPGHEVFDELAAGHALDALEPEDERRFLRHATDCPRCRQSVADFRQVAAALAETAAETGPSAQLGDRILAAARADSGRLDHPAAARAPQDEGPAGVVPFRSRPRKSWHKPAAVAAAAALLAGGGIWAGLAATASGPQLPLAVCARPHACMEVVLRAGPAQRPVARVVISDGVAWMEPAAMAANPASEIYVLWQITGAHVPLAVGSFDVRSGARVPIRVGSLAEPYAGTWAFAVSLEHGRTIPASPSPPVALGQVS